MGKRVLTVKKPSLKARLVTARDLVREYLDINIKLKSMEQRKKEIQDFCLELLDEIERKSIDIETPEGGPLRLQKITVTKAKFNVRKLVSLFLKKGLKAESKKVFKISVDDNELARVIEDGKVTVDEIKELSEVRETFHFRADRLQESEEDVPF